MDCLEASRSVRRGQDCAEVKKIHRLTRGGKSNILRVMFFLDPPVPVAGHPVELLEIHPGPRSAGITAYVWRVKVRVVLPDRPAVEAHVRYAEDRRIMFEKFPEDVDALRVLLVSRGRCDHTLASSNPLAETIEDVIKASVPPPSDSA